ncbi:MAG: hypothetical protein H7A23_21895 [Leptospiraceae bacterium]|nr:hypothetical protein [Leptospiraceae bacterium]MCP5497215.1 hypothetical protein [Leptospiraceae bacterium]
MTIMYELQRSRTPDFKKPLIIYNGYDKATFISGMPEGNFYFRVRALKDKQTAVTEWSDTIEVEVEYQSAFLTITLLFAGAGIFLAIVLVVIIGNFKTKEDLGVNA